MSNFLKNVLEILRFLAMLLPFILFALWNMKANLKKEIRSKQFLMPIIALIFCILLLIFSSRLGNWLLGIVNAIPELIARFGNWVNSLFDGVLTFVGDFIIKLSDGLKKLIEKANPAYLMLFVFNAAFMFIYIVAKKIIINILRGIFKNDGRFHNAAAGIFYEKDTDTGYWCVKKNLGQARTFLKTLYIAGLIVSCVTVLAACMLYKKELLTALFYPIFGIIIVGEIYFFTDGYIKGELHTMLTGEDEESDGIRNYSLMRPVLRKLFGDKLGAEDTTVSREGVNIRTNDEVLSSLEDSDDPKVEIYGHFMRKKTANGLELDRNYLVSGLDLLNGKSILFNNPFYYDLIPYVFYPMNRTLLRHKKVLIILGRHGIENDIEQWCNDGFMEVTNVPSMWNVGVLTDKPQNLEVGIVTRSSVHDLKLHEANEEFFSKVEFTILIEPSRLVTTAQVGLNSIIRLCKQNGKQHVFCSTDKNCDGLVDALSHILMTSISEVSATNRHTGASSYMCWDTDGDYLQHRMLPNLSRYLGVGTEMSFAALKNQISETYWYGGDAFPVVDTHWIAKQYYYDLLDYANLPTTQETLDEKFKVTHNMWNAKKAKHLYMTVEDEAFNMFEVKRDFATRATEQGFVNVISSEYLLKDYMEQNNDIFNADPKAVPYLVADYAHTERNVILRLCLRMSVGMVSEVEVRRELMLIDAHSEDLRGSLWHQLCKHCWAKESVIDKNGNEVLELADGINTEQFSSDVIRVKRKFSMKSGKMEEMFFITDSRFISVVLGDLKSAGYIAEDENGERQYLGAELLGHVFQKYLPGQFFTFNGKYYEMLKVAGDGQVVVRRAADHITGRPAYRQVRNYTILNVTDSECMGDRVDIGGLKVTKQYADVYVETPAYWQLDKYNDFAHGRKVMVNGIPQRVYRNKQILRIDLPETADFTEEVCSTITLLFNEVFRTLFAENQGYIIAVKPGDVYDPNTYSLTAEGVETGANCFYIIEDSQLDIGLLVAVKRNLNRIFSIICDYLEWHLDALEASMNPPPEPVVPEFVLEPEEQTDEPASKLGRILRKIGLFFKKIGKFFAKIFKKIGDFFKKLFKKKPKPDEPVENVPEPVETDSDAAEDAETEESADGETEGDNGDETEPSEGAAESVGENTAAENTPEEESASPLDESEKNAETESISDAKTDKGNENRAMFSIEGSGEDNGAASEEIDSNGETETIPDDKDVIEFEPENAVKPVKTLARLPYHERYYLRYGGSDVPSGIAPAATKEYLKALNFGDCALKQARDGKGIAEMIERSFVPNKSGTHYCDFCGAELAGTEYEVLADGRERCMICGKTAVKTAEEFVAIYKECLKNLDAFYCVKINAPVNVKMVNSKKLHKRLGKSFVPTGNADGRVLGVAIKDKDGYSILVENGAPRLKAIMTMVHELTHIWQYLNWDAAEILKKYGPEQELEVYEGMAKWSEIQYAYLINEPATAKREEIITRLRDDEYGRGFNKYTARYPLSIDTYLKGSTPFDDVHKPL